MRHAVEREAVAWELASGTPSQLRDEIDALGELLAVHPLIGIRKRGRGHYRKVQLRVTGFVVHYRVEPRKRMVTILGLAPGPSLKHR
jgi:mRNA-degrading endonuclease RelE of RelBE toxin-antitoxin system